MPPLDLGRLIVMCETIMSAVVDPVDVVWLKKDIRLHDHGPLSLIAQSSPRQCVILYLYEPDQLAHKTVHGSHVEFVNEGLVDLDLRLSGKDPSNIKFKSIYEHKFQCLTVCYGGAAFTLQAIHKQRPIHQILCHLESGHLKSFARDKAVRRWCRSNNVTINELDQTGVTRCLKDRDDFTKNFNRFLDRPLWQTPTKQQLEIMRRDRLISAYHGAISLHGMRTVPMNPAEIQQLPDEHKADRAERQHGGETEALAMLLSFLNTRGCDYSAGISSPNTSWTSCSRLSPYLTWGNISLRYVIVMTKRKQEELREAKKKNKGAPPNPWLRSLASFQSRMHWRSHFMQKLESQPNLEEQDQCLAFSHLRRQPGDFNQHFYDAWCQGRTGYPFVDACMRCLMHCGWINFRMRAMLVSFATYNLWLDWKKIAPHLARLFLDYEPGIHYPQLQMQAGTTGINAMRVYNVTKQGQDQDPDGIFIRKYVPELTNVPNEYIHEPFKMPIGVQKKCSLLIVGKKSGKASDGLASFVKPTENNSTEGPSVECQQYPYPIIDEKASAKVSKDKMSAVRKQQATKEEAQKVYIKHGSRRTRFEDRNDAAINTVSNNTKRAKKDEGQRFFQSSWFKSETSMSEQNVEAEQCIDDDDSVIDVTDCTRQLATSKKTSDVSNNDDQILSQKSLASILKSETSPKKQKSISSFLAKNNDQDDHGWECKICTFINDKPHALACFMCRSIRS